MTARCPGDGGPMTCTPGTHYYNAHRCTYCAQPPPPPPSPEPACPTCAGTRIGSLAWADPPGAWRFQPCQACQGTGKLRENYGANE